MPGQPRASAWTKRSKSSFRYRIDLDRSGRFLGPRDQGVDVFDNPRRHLW